MNETIIQIIPAPRLMYGYDGGDSAARRLPCPNGIWPTATVKSEQWA